MIASSLSLGVLVHGFGLAVSRDGQRARNRHCPSQPLTRSMLVTGAPVWRNLANAVESSALAPVNSVELLSEMPGKLGCVGSCLWLNQGRIKLCQRSAELNSAVSQNSILQGVGSPLAPARIQRLAECNSAVQQVENLRYRPSLMRP